MKVMKTSTRKRDQMKENKQKGRQRVDTNTRVLMRRQRRMKDDDPPWSRA